MNWMRDPAWQFIGVLIGALAIFAAMSTDAAVTGFTAALILIVIFGATVVLLGSKSNSNTAKPPSLTNTATRTNLTTGSLNASPPAIHNSIIQTTLKPIDLMAKIKWIVATVLGIMCGYIIALIACIIIMGVLYIFGMFKEGQIDANPLAGFLILNISSDVHAIVAGSAQWFVLRQYYLNSVRLIWLQLILTQIAAIVLSIAFLFSPTSSGEIFLSGIMLLFVIPGFTGPIIYVGAKFVQWLTS